MALHRRDIGRCRQEIDHRIEQGLHAAVLECAAAQHRHNFTGNRALAQRGLDFGLGQRHTIQVFLQQFFAGFRRGFDHAAVPFLGHLLQRRRDLDVFELDALRGIVPHDRLHLDQVDHAMEIIFRPDRDLHRDRIAFQAFADLLMHAQEIGADAIHLVDEGQPRHLVFVGLPPHGFRLRLHAADRVVHHAGAVQHAHRALDLDREIDVARGVDDVDPMHRIIAGHPFPEAGGGGRRDRDAAFLFLLHPVHRRGAVVHLAQFVVDPRIEQDALGGGGLAGVDVGADTDVAVAFYGGFSSHGSFLGYVWLLDQAVRRLAKFPALIRLYANSEMETGRSRSNFLLYQA